MSTRIQQLFSQHGKEVEASTKAPLSLCVRQSAWLVEEGEVHLFAVATSEGTRVGPRRHLCTLPAGSLLFALGASSETLEQDVLVVGVLGSRLREVDLERLLEIQTAEPAELAILMDRWIDGLMSAFEMPNVPRLAEDMPDSDRLELTRGEVMRPREQLTWVRSAEDTAHIVHQNFHLLAGEFLPVPTRGWIEARQRTELEAAATQALLQRGMAAEILQGFHSAFSTFLAFDWSASSAKEQRRLRVKLGSLRSSVARSFIEFTSILRPRATLDVPFADDGDDLRAAMILVGQQAGLVVRARPAADEDGRREERLARIAQASRLRYRKVALRDDWWKRDNGPIVGFVKSTGAAVALLQTTPTRYEIVDPSSGERTAVEAQSAAELRSFGFSLYGNFPSRVLKALDVLRIGSHGLKRDALEVALTGLAGGVLGMLPAIFTGILFDHVIPSSSQTQLVQLVAVLVIGALAAAAFQMTRGIAMLRITGRLDAALGAAVADRLLSLPVPFFGGYTAGDLAVRAGAIGHLRELLTSATIAAVLGGIFSVFNLMLLFYYSPGLALTATGIVLAVLVLSMALAYRTLRYQRPARLLQQRIAGRVLQLLTGISKLRVSATEPAAFARWARDFAAQRKLEFRARVASNWLGVVNSVVPIVAPLIIFYQAAGLQQSRPITTGSFLAFYAAFVSFLAAVTAMTNAFAATLRAVPLYENARPILETLPEIDEIKADPGELRGDIELNEISFRYQDGGPLVLKDLSLRIAAGEFVALVGPSGSGKSTLFRLLLGFEKPEAGTILFGHHDLAMVDLVSVRRQVGVVLQNSQLLAGDIFHNITGTSSARTLDEVREATRLAAIDEEIEKLPMGLHTYVTQGGGTFSGGQRQRILLARALVNRPRILLLDEATSALDNRTQEIVSRNLSELRVTRLLIAHRLSTVVGADRICVIERGRLAESGTYEQLMDDRGRFYELARRQIA